MRGERSGSSVCRQQSPSGPRRAAGAGPRPLAPHLGCLQVLQHKVPELGRGVQQQELEASRGDAGWLSGLSTGDGERDNAPIVRERPQSPLVLSHLQVYLWLYSTQLSFSVKPLHSDPPRHSVPQALRTQRSRALLCFWPSHLFMSPAWLRSWAKSWLTAALGEPTMKCRTT